MNKLWLSGIKFREAFWVRLVKNKDRGFENKELKSPSKYFQCLRNILVRTGVYWFLDYYLFTWRTLRQIIMEFSLQELKKKKFWKWIYTCFRYLSGFRMQSTVWFLKVRSIPWFFFFCCCFFSVLDLYF